MCIRDRNIIIAVDEIGKDGALGHVGANGTSRRQRTGGYVGFQDGDEPIGVIGVGHHVIEGVGEPRHDIGRSVGLKHQGVGAGRRPRIIGEVEEDIGAYQIGVYGSRASDDQIRIKRAERRCTVGQRLIYQ